MNKIEISDYLKADMEREAFLRNEIRNLKATSNKLLEACKFAAEHMQPGVMRDKLTQVIMRAEGKS